MKRLYRFLAILPLIFTYPSLGQGLVGSQTRVSSVSTDGSTNEDSESIGIAYSSTSDVYLIVWAGDDTADELGIFGQLINADDGTELGSDFAIDAGGTGETHTLPQVVWNDDTDEFLVVWQADDNGTRYIYAQRVDNDGTLLGSAQVVATGVTDLKAPSVTYNTTDNEYFVVYVDFADLHIDGRFLASADATPGTSVLDITDSGSPTINETPKVVWNSTDNEYFLIWNTDADAAGIYDVHGQLMDKDGVDIGSNFTISAGGVTNSDSRNPDVVYDPIQNQYLVVYSADFATDTEYEIFRVIVSAVGALTATQTSISSNTSANYPEAVYDPFTDSYFVAFLDIASAAVDRELYVQELTNAGAETGTDDFPLIVNGTNVDGSAASDYRIGMAQGRLSSFIAATSTERIDLEHEVYSQIYGIAENNVVINRTDASPTNASTINFTVTFDLSVSNVTDDDFVLTTTGTASGNISGTSGSGTSWNVPVTTLAGDGTIRLDLNSGTDIDPAIDNVPYTGGQVYSVDLTAPNLQSSVPVSGTNNFLLGQDIVLSFDDDMAKAAGGGDIRVRRLSDDVIFETIDITTGQVTIAGGDITINPTSNLVKGESYYLEVDAAAFENTLGTSYAGFTGSGTLSFTTVDIVINEVVLEPQNDWSGGNFTSTPGATTINAQDDWIELYISSDGVDLSSSAWIIEVDNGDNASVDFSGNLEDAGSFVVSHYITSGSGTYANTESGDFIVLGTPISANDIGASLPVRITLKDGDGSIIDEVVIGTGGFTDYVTTTGVGDESVFRRPNGVDTDVDADDFFQNYASIGSTNPEFPLITNATWLDENPQDGTIDRLQLDFNEAVNITDAGAGFDAITISGGITIDDQDYSDNTGTATSLTLDVSNVSTGTADPGVTVQYDIAGSSTIISNASANEVPNGETPDTYVDAAEPYVLNALSIDSGTPDGTIDEIEIEFSENVTDADVIPSDFALSTDAGSTSDGFNTRSTDVFSIATDAVANDQYIRLTITSPANVTGTGAAQLSYTSTTSIDDAAGNVMSDFGFTSIGDGAAPILIGSTPDDEDIGVPGANDLTLNFSETVQAGTGNIEINGTNGPTYDVTTAGQLSFGSNLVINPDAPLESLTAYNLLIDATAITDGNGNDYAGLIAGDLNFTTQANPPTISSATWLDANPQDGVIDQLRLDFGEAVDIDDQNAAGGFDPIVISGGVITIDNADYSDLSGTATSLILDVSGVTSGTADPGVTITYSDASSSSITSNAYGLEIINGTSPSSIVDGALPVIVTALTIDDGDGTVDAMEIEFSEPILDAGISGVGGFADWTLDDGTNGATPFTGFSTAVTDLASDGDADDQYITLTINAGVSGTGAMSYAYSNTLGDITDASAQANVLADIGTTLANDGSAPIVLNAVTLDDGDGDVDALELEFSEPMNEASLSGNFSDWTLNDGTNGPAAFTGFSTQTDVVSGGTVNTASDQYATLTISTGVVGTGVMNYAYGGVAITDNSAQAVALATITATAADDDAAPTITGYTLEGSNTYLDVDFSEEIYGSDGIIESVKADWTITFDQNVGGGGTATAAEIGDITTTGDVVIPSNTGVSTIRFNLIFTGNQSGDELIAISPVDGASVADISPASNLMSGAQTTGNISVNTVTAVIFDISSSSNADNTEVNLVFSEGVGRNSGGSGALRYNDAGCNPGGGVDELCAEFVDPDGLLTETFASNAVSHSGGNSSLTFSFSLDGDADGNEYIRFRPADGNEIRGTINGNMQATHFIDVPLSDEVPPTFASATYYDHDENGYIDEVVIVMSEPIDDSTIDPNDFIIGGTAATGIVTGGSIQNGIDTNTSDDDTFTLSANTQGTGGLTIAYTEDAAGTALADPTGNAAADDAGITATDLAAPVILSATTRDSDANGQIETIEVTFSEDVDFTTLDLGGADFTVTSPAYVITAAAQNGSNAADLTLTESGSTDVNVTPTITLLNGAIDDSVPNRTTGGDFSITATDGSDPYFASLDVNDPAGYYEGELMTLDIDMEETGLTLTVNLQNLNASLSSSQALADDGDGTYSYSLFVSSAMTEATGIVLPITATDGNSNSLLNSPLTVDLDFTAPTVDITPVFTSDLSPALSGSVNDATATIEVSINGGGPYTATNAGATWSLAQGTITPDLTTNTTYSVTVTATDPAGNTTTDATNGEVKIDNTAPTITSINRSNPLVSTTNASTVVFRVTFDEGVKGVDAGDFDISAFTATNTADAPVVSHISGGSVYDVTINNISGSGSLALDVSSATITDSVTVVSPNAFAGTVGVSQSYEIDQTQPTVLSVVKKDANPTSAGTVNFRATFSEPVTNVTADGSDFDVNTSGPTIGAVAVTQVSSSIYDISIAVSGTSGDVFIESNAGQDITDLYGNGWDDTTVPSETYNIDYTAPSEDAASVSAIGQDATLSVDLNEAGTVYYVVLLSGDAAPAAASDIRDLTNNAASPEASGTLSIPSGASAYEASISLPDPKTGYVVYLALEDLASPTKNITAGSVLPITSGGVTLSAGALPSDLCLEGPSKTLSDITITEGINNDFRTGTGLKLRLNLPSGFEYDQTATVTTTGSTLNDISAVSFSYPASNTLQVTYTVNSTTGADELVISGIEVQAVGSTAYASANIERGGGNAVIFGAEGTDNPVLGTVSSVVRPSGPSYAEDGTYTVGVSSGDTNGDDVALFTTATINKFGPGAITVLTIEPDGNNTGYTINIYDDEALTNNIYSQTGATSYTPTLTDFGRSATSYGIQTYYITQVDSPNGCESDPVEYSIAIAQINLSPNNTIFSESDTDGTTISINHQGSQTIAFSGNGLASIELGTNPATADFIPSAAGVSTGHVINFSMTNATSGELATFKRTFRVVAEANIFGSDNSYDIYAGNSYDCIESTNSSISIQDPYAGGNTNDGDPDFYELRFFAYKGDVSSTDVTASIVTNGTVGSAGAGTGVANNTKGNPDDWTIDPSLYTLGDGGIDTIAVALYTINETTDVISRQTQGLIYLYPLPTVTVDNIGIANSSDYFSEDDASTDISVSITSLGVTSSGTITNGFVLYEDTDDNGTYETQVKDYTATGIDGLNNTFDPAVEGVGKYEILYETPGQTIAGCTNTVTAQLEVVSKPGTPTINTALLADGKTDGFGSSDPGGAYYMVEYVGGNTLDDLTAEFAGATGDERFNWYTNSSLTTMVADATLSGTQKEVIDIPTALFAGISTPNTRQTKQLWLTVSDHVAIDGSTYEGAESEPIEIIIQVYPNPSIPVLTGDFPNVASATNELNKAQVGADFVFEYCVAAGGTATIETIELNTGTLNVEVDGITSEDYSSESYFTIWDGSTPVRENQVGTITAADLNALFGFDGSAGSLTFTVSQTDYDNNFDGSGFAFDGCESSERTFTIEVNEIPDAPNPDDFNGFNNSGVVEYYSCSGDALSTILTPQLSGSAYTWYEDNAGTPAASSLTIAAFNDNLVAESELTGFNRTVATETTVTYWVTQTTDFNNSGSGFLGCESDYTRVDITVYPDPDPISFDANGSGDLEISYCEGELGSVTFPITGDVSNSTFVYYGSDAAQTIQTAAVNLFGGDSDADGAVTVSSSDLLLANATQTNSPYYFLVAQTTNINPDGSDFDGCRTEVSDMAHLTVHVFDIPSTPSIADATLFYCEDDGVNEVTVTSSETGPVEYNWYEADTDGYPTGSPLLTETNSSGSSTINNVGLGLDAAVNTPGVYRYVVSQTSDINSGNGTHDGCESSYRLVTITIYGTPNSPTVSDPLPQCQLEVTGTSTIIQYSGVSTDAGNTEFIWYDDAAGTNVIATIATANPTSSSNFTYGGITSFTPNGNDTVRSVYVRQVTNIQGGESFGGCESELSEVKLVVYPEPTTPTTIGNSGTTNLYEFCEGEDLTGIEIEIQGASVDEEYIWYPINTGNFQSAALDTASTLNILDFLDGEELSGKDFDINENIEGVTDYTFYVSKLTERQPALGFDGCESNLTSVTIRVNPLPQAPATGVFPDLNTEYCYDDGDITFGAQLVVDGTPVTPTSGTYDVISGGIGVITDNGDGTATINPESLALAVGETREGGSSTHSIEFVYTSDKGCEETFTKDITINAQPTLDIVYQNSTGLNSALDPLDASFICYEQGTFTIRGIQELNNATRGTFSISYEGSPVPNGNGFNDLGNGTAQIVSSNLMMFANEPNEGSPRDFTVTFTYGDDNTCDNSVSHTFTIEPQPTLDIQYEAAVVGFSDIGDALEGSTVCYDEGTITIGGEVSYLSGTVLDIEQSGQSDSIQFSINTGGLTDNGDGTATITLSTAAVSAAGNTNGVEDGLPTSHIVTLFYTDANGCDNEVEHEFTINPLPRLDIQVPDNSPCFDDDVMTLQGRQESGSEIGLTPATSGSFSIYSDEALTTPLATSGFVDNGDGTSSFDPDVIALDYFSLTYDEVRTGDVATVYIQFDYTDASGTSCLNTSEATIISIQPQPNISFRIEQNSNLVLSEDLADDRYYVSAAGSTLLVAGWDLDANAGAGAPLADGAFFIDGSIGATQNGEMDFDPNGPLAKTEIYTAPEDFEVSYSYTDNESCENTVSKTITVLPVPEFYTNSDGENIENIQACLTQDIIQQVSISNLDALGVTIDQIDFTWKANVDGYDDLESALGINVTYPNDTTVEIRFRNDVDPDVDGEAGLPEFEGNITFTVTAQYDYETGLTQGEVQPSSTSQSRIINIGETPQPKFRWDNTTVGAVTAFDMSDLTNSQVEINDVSFEVYRLPDTQNPIEDSVRVAGFSGYTSENIKDGWTYAGFDLPGDYLVRVTYNSTSSCVASEERIVTISDIIVIPEGEDSVWVQNFENGNDGWYLDSVDYVSEERSLIKVGYDAYSATGENEEVSVVLPTWELGTTPDFGDLNQSTFWVTNINGAYNEDEQSFVYSPAYDFSHMSLPTLNFRYACDMDIRDGVVFQYSTDDGLTWSPLGTYDFNEGTTGKNWFNAEGINGDPGSIDGSVLSRGAFNNDQYGWNSQGGEPLSEDEEEIKWRAAAHKLDAIDRTGPVRFRFALGSSSAPKEFEGGYYAGFAFDDFKIYDRTKLIVVEQFASLGTDASEAVQDTLNSRLDDELRSDALLINYFTDLGSSTDVLNSRNTKDPGARSLYYGVSTSPKSVITGQVQENDDSDPVGWNINKFNSVALDEPQFTIGNITIGGDEQHVDISIDSFTSKVDIDSADSELSFRVAIVEKTVAGDLVGQDASVVYRNVLRKMLPSAGGKTYVGAVNEGQTVFGELTFDYSWPISKVFDPNNLAVIVFVQLDKDVDETKGLTRGAILQAKTVDVGGGKIVPDASNITSVLPGKEFSIYPNPSDREFEVELAGMALEEMQWVLYDQAGRQVLSGDIGIGESRKLISAESLPSGIFMLHIFNENTRWSPKRVIVVH